MLRACNIWRNLIIIWRKIWYIALSPFVLEHFDRVTFQRMQTLLKVTSGPPPFFKSFHRWHDPQGAWLLLFLSEYHVIPSVHGTSGPPSWTCLCTWIFCSCIIPCKGAQFWSICVPIALHPVLYAESAAKLHHPSETPAFGQIPLCSPPVPATALTPHPEMPLCLKDLLCFSPERILLFFLSFGPCFPAPLPRRGTLFSPGWVVP